MIRYDLGIDRYIVYALSPSLVRHGGLTVRPLYEHPAVIEDERTIRAVGRPRQEHRRWIGHGARAIVDYLRGKGEATTGEIAEELGKSRDTIYYTLTRYPGLFDPIGDYQPPGRGRAEKIWRLF